jgi:hypothetical protein
MKKEGLRKSGPMPQVFPTTLSAKSAKSEPFFRALDRIRSFHAAALDPAFDEPIRNNGERLH